MQFDVTVLPGDGVGPEVTTEAIKVLQAIGKRFDHSFNLHYGLVGGVAIDETGEALPRDTLKMCQSSVQCCLVRWVVPSGMTPRLRFVLRMVFWNYGRLWGFLPICARLKYRRFLLIPPI